MVRKFHKPAAQDDLTLTYVGKEEEGGKYTKNLGSNRYYNGSVDPSEIQPFYDDVIKKRIEHYKRQLSSHIDAVAERTKREMEETGKHAWDNWEDMPDINFVSDELDNG